MRNKIRVLLLLVFIFCFGMFIRLEFQKQKAEESYKRAEELAAETTVTEATTERQTEEPTETETEPVTEEVPKVWRAKAVEEDPYMEELSQKDLAPLREVNPDVLGWIWIPDTQVDYPIMDGEDNDYYLEHTWDRQPSLAGSIGLECMNSSDLSDFNTLLYGHRMKNETMFGSLKHYNRMEYYQAHPYVYILDDSGVHRYEVFSAYTAPVDGDTFLYGFLNEAHMLSFLEYCKTNSVIDIDVNLTPNDRILTLVTCTGNGYEARWVVHARLEGEEDNPRKFYVFETETKDSGAENDLNHVKKN